LEDFDANESGNEENPEYFDAVFAAVDDKVGRWSLPKEVDEKETLTQVSKVTFKHRLLIRVYVLQ